MSAEPTTEVRDRLQQLYRFRAALKREAKTRPGYKESDFPKAKYGELRRKVMQA